MSYTKAVPAMKAKEVASVLKQTLAGLDYIHSDGMIHRDIKSANILYNQSGCIKIADFGVSGQTAYSFLSRSAEMRTTFVGTPSYIAPEIIMGSPYDQKVDIWSLGIFCIEMASGIAPYSDKRPLKILTEILKHEPPTLEIVAISKDQFKKYPKSFNKFTNLSLRKEPQERMMCDELLVTDFIVNNAKGPSYIVSSILLNNTLKILEHKLDSKEIVGNYSYKPSDDEDEEDSNDSQKDNKKEVDTEKIVKDKFDTTPLDNTVAVKKSPSLNADKLCPAVMGTTVSSSGSENKNERKNVTHLTLKLRNLNDNELQTVEFEVSSHDDWKQWATDMYKKNLIRNEHIESMSNALRLVMDNDFAALTFKLDKHADAVQLDKENLIGYAQLKVSKSK